MNTNSNTYTIIYSAVMVILVAAVLAILAISLKEPQEKNKEIEKMQSILMSAGKGQVPKGADKNAFIEDEYKKYIIDSYAVGVDGNKKDGEKAFDIDLKVQLEAPAESRKLPVFVFQDNGAKTFILPLRGTGLWGPIWGYVAVAADGSTVVGAVFDHKGETPGLGAEIGTSAFSNQFVGKEIFDGTTFTSIEVKKPGSKETTIHNVDGISGGTITSTGVSTMLRNCLTDYKEFLLKQKSNTVPVTDSLTVQQQPTDSTTVGATGTGSTGENK